MRGVLCLLSQVSDSAAALPDGVIPDALAVEGLRSVLMSVLEVSGELAGGVIATLRYESEPPEDPAAFLAAVSEDVGTALGVGTDRYAILGYRLGSVLVDVLFLPPASGASAATPTAAQLARELEAQSVNPTSALRARGQLGGALADGGVELNIPPLPAPDAPPAVPDGIVTFSDELLIFAGAAVLLEILVMLVAWPVNRYARAVQLATVASATTSTRPADDRAGVLAGAVRSLKLPAGTPLMLGPPPRYNSLFSAPLSAAQFIAFAVYLALVVGPRSDSYPAYLIAGAASLACCFVGNAAGGAATLVAAQTALDDWDRAAFASWFAGHRALTLGTVSLSPFLGTSLDIFLLLGSYISPTLAAPWGQANYNRLLAAAIGVDLITQSIPQVRARSQPAGGHLRSQQSATCDIYT